MEEYAWVIEYLPLGHSHQLKKEPIVQLIGEQFFTLLEATAKPEAKLAIGQRLFVGKEGRAEIDRIKGRVTYDQITVSARGFLPQVIKKIVHEREQRFVDFINKCGPLTIRSHQLELLPGIGKKNLGAILTEREKQPFTNFEDIKTRVPSLSDPAIVFVHRIDSELQGKEKYYLFTKPPQSAYPQH